MYWSYLKTISFVLILVIIFGGGYLWFRNSDARALAAAYRNGYTNFHPAKYKAAVCTGFEGGFEGAAVGKTYFYQGMERTDYTYFQSNIRHGVHYFVDKAGERFQWNDGSDVGGRAPATSDAWKAGGVTSSSLNCVPWWSPDPSMFTLPDGVIFKVLK